MGNGLKAVGLPNRGVLRVAGEDARAWLDNLVTNAMAGVAPGLAAHAALLTPQGKIIGDFIVTEAAPEDGGGFYLDAPLVATPELAKRLALYKLRAKVAVEDLSEELGVVAIWGGAFAPESVALAYADPRLAALGWRMIVHRSQIDTAVAEFMEAPADFPDHHALRAALGIGEAAFDYQPGDAFPHEINMDQLHGVDFKKGCYVGQEVVSRMQHRGTARTRLVQLAYEDGFAAAEGAPVTAGEKTLGVAGTSGGGLGLAMLRLDRAAEAVAAGVPIAAGGVPARIVRPAWWTASWPLP
jgi:tRNA-modifying protein YgfZ